MGSGKPIAYLKITGPDAQESVAELHEGITRFGRHPSCDLKLEGTQVSRNHGRITILDGQAVVQDQGSQNGTFVNGDRVRTLKLSEGDLCRVGEFTLCFSWSRPSVPLMLTAVPSAPSGSNAPQLPKLRPTHPTLERPVLGGPAGQVVTQLAQALFRAPNLEQGGAQALGLAVELLEATRGRLFLVVDGAPSSLVEHGQGASDLTVSEAAARWAADRQVELRIERVAEDPRFQHLQVPPELSLLVLPLIRRRKPSESPPPTEGVLVLERDGHPFSPQELEVAIALGQLIALGAPSRLGGHGQDHPPREALCSPALLREVTPDDQPPQLGLALKETSWLMIEFTGLHPALAEHGAVTTAALNRLSAQLIRSADELGGVVHTHLDGRWLLLLSPEPGDLQRAAALALALGEALREQVAQQPQLRGVGWRAALSLGMGWQGGVGGPRGWRLLSLSPTVQLLNRMLDANRSGGLWVEAEATGPLQHLRLQPVRMAGAKVFHCQPA